MKKSLYLIIIFLNSSIVEAQLPPWTAKFIVTNPLGLMDTVWVGCNEDADAGYQEGIDIFEENFSPPVGISAFDETVEEEFEFGTCVNLEKDVRNFLDGGIIEYQLLVLTSTYPDIDNFTIRWDTLDFIYDNDGMQLTYAWLESELGYIAGIDGERYDFMFPEISAGDTTIDFLENSTDMYPFDSIDDCSEGAWAMQVNLFVAFNIYPVGIESISLGNKIAIYPNPVKNHLHIKNDSESGIHFGVYDMVGKLIIKSTINQFSSTELDVSTLEHGMYIVEIIDPNSKTIFSKQIFKN